MSEWIMNSTIVKIAQVAMAAIAKIASDVMAAVEFSLSALYSHLTSTPQRDFEKNLSEWCEEKKDTEEYEHRLIAADKIRTCYKHKITTFVLFDTQLTTLPEAIGYLVHLQELTLCSNELTALPEAIGKLVNLEKLELSDNKLTALPVTIVKLANLLELNLPHPGKAGFGR